MQPESTYTNNNDIPLLLAAWLVTDEYDHNPASNYISATTLIKPLRQLILAQRLPQDTAIISDISRSLKARIGTAIHDSIERAWKDNYQDALRLLGYPDHYIDRIRINPTDDELKALPEMIPLYTEQRESINIDGVDIGGKYDFILDGELMDIKTTSTYTYVKDTKSEDYSLQGSLYRLMNPDKVFSDFININFIFLDWAKHNSYQNNYPPADAMSKKYPLLSIADTTKYVKDKIFKLNYFKDTPQDAIPKCTEKDLWQDPPVWKYMASPTAKKSSKNFDTAVAAYSYASGKKGHIVEVPAKVKACNYCPALSICTQKDEYIANGSLTLL